MNLPNEILNKVFSYIESPTALIIKNAYIRYSWEYYDEEDEDTYITFTEFYFNRFIQVEFCRCHMIDRGSTKKTKCFLCYCIEYNNIYLNENKTF
jgi:hypothetical protein